MDFKSIYEIIIHKLENELPIHLSYHNVQHTIYVIEKTIELSKLEGLDEEKMKLLKLAALFHDSGFLVNNVEHEIISCEIAKNTLEKHGYSTSEISEICEMIMATKIPQSPKTLSAKILCDADLYYLGSDNYLMFAEELFQENKALGIIKNRSEWKNRQLNFLENHRYLTNSANTLLNNSKMLNLEQLKQSHNESATSSKA